MRDPDYDGPLGRFWELKPGEKTAAHYAVEAPGQSPFWDRYIVAVLDLEGPSPLDGTTADLDFPDARWEVAVWALDPEPARPGWPDDPSTGRGIEVLTPQNVRAQLPDHPRELVVDATRAVLIGALAGIWGLRLEPLYGEQSEIWGAVLAETIRHPYHEGDDRRPTE